MLVPKAFLSLAVHKAPELSVIVMLASPRAGVKAHVHNACDTAVMVH